MKIFKSAIVAFSMYSKIPMPKTEWTQETMKYAICFFPLIGFVEGVALILWTYISGLLAFNIVLYAAVACYIPILITGGIHMDGFCDTIDARASNQTKEKRLRILKDPNAGAFAVINTGIYYILYFAVFTQVTYNSIMIIALGYIISRALSGISLINFPSAKPDGTAALFKSTAHKKVVNVVLLTIIVYLVCSMIYINVPLGVAATLASALTVLYYYRMSKNEFGGVTGDLAGYFLQLCEIVIPYSVVIMEGIMKNV